MKLYSRDGATAVTDPNTGETYSVDDDGAIDVPIDFYEALHHVHVDGKRVWENEPERFDRISAQELRRRQDPGTLLDAVEGLRGNGLTAAQLREAEDERKKIKAEREEEDRMEHEKAQERERERLEQEAKNAAESSRIAAELKAANDARAEEQRRADAAQAPSVTSETNPDANAAPGVDPTDQLDPSSPTAIANAEQLVVPDDVSGKVIKDRHDHPSAEGLIEQDLVEHNVAVGGQVADGEIAAAPLPDSQRDPASPDEAEKAKSHPGTDTEPAGSEKVTSADETKPKGSGSKSSKK